VQALRRLSILILPLVVVALLTGPALGQDADADKAKTQLKQGLDQYNSLDFKSAKKTFLAIDPGHLGDADKNLLKEKLGAVDAAIRQQTAAQTAYDEAVAALKGNDLDKAETGFATAAGSEFLPAATRKDASAQLAEVKVKKQKLAELATASAKPAETPAPATTEKPAEKPAETPAAQAGDASKRMLADLAERRKKAQELTDLARKALDDRKPDLAVQYLTQAGSIEPDNAEIDRLLRYARNMTGTAGSAGLLPEYLQNMEIAKQAALVDFEKQMKLSHESLAGAKEEKDFAQASQAASAARNIVETNKNLLPAKEYQTLLQRVDEQERFISLKQGEWRKSEVAKQVQKMEEMERKRRADTEFRRNQKVQTLQAQVQTLMGQRDYPQAMESLDQILKVDPTNAWALERRDLLQNFVLLQGEKEAFRARNVEQQKQAVELRWEEVPWWEYIRYPKDWKELTKRRELLGASSLTESEADRRVRQSLRQPVPKLDFDNIEFKDVIRFLREVTGANIYVKWKALEAVGIDKANTVNVHLKDVTFEKALKIILADVGGVNPLSFVIDEGVITISTKDDLSRQTVTRVYDIRDLIVRVPNFSGPRMDISNLGNVSNDNNSSSSSGGLFGTSNNATNNNDEDKVPTRSEIIDNIKQMITSTIDPTSWAPTGEVGSIRELHGQLVVTQTAENHQALMQLIDQLREARSLQVNIEARFISVNTGFLNDIGVDLDVYFNLGSRLGSGSVVDPATGATVPTSTGTSGWGTGKPGVGQLTPMGLTNDSRTFGSVLGRSTGAPTSIGTGVTSPAMSIGGTFLSDIQVDFLIQATQAHTTTRLLTAPRLTLYNGQRAYVTVSTQQAYIAGLEPVVSDNAIGYRRIIRWVPTGTVLDVEATVSADRRYVTLTVRPQISTLNSMTAITSLGETILQLPNVTVQELQSTVTVPDGGTLLLGGQMLAGEIEREMGVPLISKIPILNRAFTNRGKVRDEQTLLILIKPKIIMPAEEERRQFGMP